LAQSNASNSERKGDSDVDEIETMQVRILRGRRLQVWLPERKNRQPDQRLHLRGSMQLLSHLQLQDQLGAGIGAAHFAVSHRPSAGPERCAAFF
jgi:hypothetical protein